MLAPGGEIDQPGPVADFALASLRAWPEFVRELEEESGTVIDYRASGALEVALNDAEAAALDAKAAHQAKFGIRSEASSHSGWYARHYPDDALVDPRHVTAALLIACRRRGVEIHENEAVLDISPLGRSIRTAQGEYEDSGVLVAAGAWSSRLFPGLTRTMPIRGHLISWPLTPGLLTPILRNGHTYLLQRRSGVLIAGVTTEHVGFDRTLDPVSVETVRSGAVRLLPELGLQSPTERWNGFRPGIDANGPEIRRIEGTSIWTAFGHYRNGILLAPETATRVAAMLIA